MKETERPTPETESSICRYACPGWPDGRPLTFDDEPTVPADFARRLERERDEARDQIHRMREHHERTLEDDSIVASCGCLTKSPEVRFHKPGCKYRLICERDELRKALIEAEVALSRHIPEGHGSHPNPEFEVVEQARQALANTAPKGEHE